MHKSFKYLEDGVVKLRGSYLTVNRCIEEGIVYYFFDGEWTSTKPEGYLDRIPEEDLYIPDDQDIESENAMLTATTWNRH